MMSYGVPLNLLIILTSFHSINLQKQKFVQCHELMMGERCTPCRDHARCFCSILKKYVDFPCVTYEGQSFLQFIDTSNEVYCPTDFLTVYTKSIYYNGYISKKFFCSCSFDKEDISPFNTCSKMWNESSESSTTAQPSTPPMICPECPREIQTVSEQVDNNKNSEINESLMRIIWMVVALLVVVIISQALILFIIIRVIVKRSESQNLIALNNIFPVQEEAVESVENDLYGQL